jgi:DNA modification methylase
LSAAVDVFAMPVHPAAELFPMMSDEEIDGLVEDIRRQGLLHPIITHEGMVLDGRNRLAACKRAGVLPRFEVWRGGEDQSPTAWVLAVNLHRRHLDTSQKAMVGARAKVLFDAEAAERRRKAASVGGSWDRGRSASNDALLAIEDGEDAFGDDTLPVPPPAPKAAPKPKHRAADDAAAMVNVSRPTIERAEKVLKTGDEKLIKAVETGAIPVSAAAAIAAKPAAERAAIVDKVVKGEAKNVQQATRRVEEERRAAAPAPARTDARVLLGDALALARAMTERPHCVVTDPPYGIEVHNTRRGDKDYADGTAYALDLFDELCALLVTRLDPSAHLYVFAGYTHVAAFKAILAKHFDVQDNPLVWVKDNHTMCDFSQWYPNKHEYILFARMKGSRRKLAACLSDVFNQPRERESTHSAEKPTALLRKLIEQSTVPGELVLDPFAGSGSTGVAAGRAKREFLGFEVDEKWHKVAVSRVSHGR